MFNLEERRINQESHIKELEKQGKEGNRFTSNLSNKQWLIFSIIGDIVWIAQFINSIKIIIQYFSLISTIFFIFPNILLIIGVVYAIILNIKKEKLIAELHQILLSIGMIVLSNFLIIISSIIFITFEKNEILPFLPFFPKMIVGAGLSLIFGVIILFSYKKGIRYSIKEKL